MPYIEKNGPLFKGNSIPEPIGKPSANSGNDGGVLKSAFSVLTEKRAASNVSKSDLDNHKDGAKKGLFDGKRIAENKFIHELENDRRSVNLDKESIKELASQIHHEYSGKIGEKDVKKEIKKLKEEESHVGNYKEKGFLEREEKLLKKQLDKN